MKILFLQDDFPPHSLGGAGNVAYTLAQALRKEGHEVFVVTATQDKKEVGEKEYEGLKISSLYSTYRSRWRAYLSLYNPMTVGGIRRTLARFKPDIVHAHNIHGHLSYHALKLAKKSGAKVFLTAHDSMLFHYGKMDSSISAWSQLRKFKKRYNPFRNIIIRHYLHYVNKIFAVSNALREVLEQNGIQNVEVLHNGIDVSAWELPTEEVEKFKTELRLVGKKIILFGGRLSAAKGGEQAVRALAEVSRKIPEAMMLVMGTKNPYAAEMVELARTLGIGERFLCFTGWISDERLKAAYQSCDVLLVPSLYLDPLPTVVLEAMACRKPVVATRFGGAKEMVEDGVTGYIVDPFDVDIIVEKTLYLLNNPLKGQEFGKAGYERLQKEFTMGHQIVELLRWYY